jgi:multidrug resistance protein
MMVDQAPTAIQAPALRFSRSEIVSILSGLMLAMFLASLDQTIVATSLSTMAQELNGWTLMSWVVSAYLVASTITTPLYGRLSDIYGRRLVLLASIGMFVGASVLCALSQTMPQLIGARILQGLGGGGLRSVSQAAIADVIPPRERGRYQGYLSSVMAISMVLGPVLGGVFVDYLSWHWIFWINIPFGLVALVLCDRNLRRLPLPRGRAMIDWFGAVLLAAATIPILLALSSVERGGNWRSPAVVLQWARRAVAGRAGGLGARGSLAIDPVAPVRQPHLCRGQRDQLHNVDGDDRADHPGAARLRDQRRAVGQPGRNSADPDDWRDRAGFIYRRAADVADRPLPHLSDRRGRGDDAVLLRPLAVRAWAFGGARYIADDGSACPSGFSRPGHRAGADRVAARGHRHRARNRVLPADRWRSGSR